MTDYYEVADTIQYVNERKGNRPPSIKTKDGGTYFTISDNGFAMAKGFKGQYVNITYYVNGRGYHVATGINGQAIPEDPRGGGGGPAQGRPAQGPQGQPPGSPYQHQPANPPQGRPASPPQQQRASGTGVVKAARMEAYSRIAVACIESGLGEAEFRQWVGYVGSALSGAPAPQPSAPPPPQEPPTPEDDGHHGGGPEQEEFLDDDIPF